MYCTIINGFNYFDKVKRIYLFHNIWVQTIYNTI